MAPFSRLFLGKKEPSRETKAIGSYFFAFATTCTVNDTWSFQPCTISTASDVVCTRTALIVLHLNRFQLVVQVGIFGSLFLMMFETYPFRVGLMGMLTSQYLTVYVINVLYFITTACVYGYRVVRNEISFANRG